MVNPSPQSNDWQVQARLGPKTGAGKAQVGISVLSASEGLSASEIEVDWTPGMEDVDVLATALTIASQGALALAVALHEKAVELYGR